MARLFVPLGTKVMIGREAFIYKGKIKIPETAKSKSSVGDIVAIGPDVTKFVVGDKVLFSRVCGLIVFAHEPDHPRANPDTGEVEWLIMDQDEIICMVHDTNTDEVEGSTDAAQAY